MAVFLSPHAVRALILAIILACFAAFTAPTARGAPAPKAEGIVLSEQPLDIRHSALGTQHLLLAEDWSWGEFVKFWQRQAGSMTGVLGTVMLVGAAAVIMILYKGKG